MPPILIVGLIFAAAFLALTLVFRSCLAAAHDRQQELLGTYIGVIMEIDRLEQLVDAQRRDLEAGETERKNLQRLVLGEAWTKEVPDHHEIKVEDIVDGTIALEEEFRGGMRGMRRLTAALTVAEAPVDRIYNTGRVNLDGLSWMVTQTTLRVDDYMEFRGVVRGRRLVEFNLEAYAAR